MDRATLAVALIGVAAAGFGGWQTLQNSGLQADIDALQKSQQNWDKDRQEQSAQYNKTITSLRQQLQDEQHQLELAKARPPEVAPAAATAVAGTKAVPAATPAPVTPQSRSGMSSVASIAQQTMANITPERRAVLVSSAYASQFSAFISGLKLAPDTEAAIKQKLLAVLTKSSELSTKVAAGEMTAKEAQAALSYRDEINKVLAEYLTREQLAAYDDYQAQAPARAQENLKKMYAMDIQSGLPGLSEQNRALVTAAYTEAMTAPASSAGMSFSERRSEAYDTTLRKLQGKIAEDQLQQVKDYFKYQRRIGEALNPGL